MEANARTYAITKIATGQTKEITGLKQAMAYANRLLRWGYYIHMERVAAPQQAPASAPAPHSNVAPEPKVTQKSVKQTPKVIKPKPESTRPPKRRAKKDKVETLIAQHPEIEDQVTRLRQEGWQFAFDGQQQGGYWYHQDYGPVKNCGSKFATFKLATLMAFANKDVVYMQT